MSVNLNKEFSEKFILDGNINTKWLSVESEEEKVLIDFKTYREIGGFIIDWDKDNYPIEYEIFFSDGDEKWIKFIQ